MDNRKIMPRAEVFAYIARIGAATMAGERVPDVYASSDHMLAEDLADAMNDFGRRVAERLDRIPEKVSDDIAIQEVVRYELDQVSSSAAAGIREAVARLPDSRDR